MIWSVFKWVFKLLLYVLAAVALWFICAVFLPKIKVNTDPVKVKKDVTIYVRTNGVHTDIVMPRQINLPNSVINYNWNNLISDSVFADVDSAYHYIAIGWGDKGFYLDTPEWKDLKFSTAFKATFGLGSTAMHVTYYKTMSSGPQTKELHISARDYQNLVAEITESFDLQNNLPQFIMHPSYGEHDNYFEAHGKYNLFKTCNVWTGNTLKTAHVKMGLWTPLQEGVMENIP